MWIINIINRLLTFTNHYFMDLQGFLKVHPPIWSSVLGRSFAPLPLPLDARSGDRLTGADLIDMGVALKFAGL